MADNPFDTLERFEDDDPFTGLQRFESPNVPGLGRVPRSLRELERVGRAPRPFPSLAFGAAETLAGPLQAGAELIDFAGGTDLAGRLERGVMHPLRERYFSSPAFFAPGADAARLAGQVAPLLAVKRIPGAAAIERRLKRVPILGRPGAVSDIAMGGAVGGLGYLSAEQSRASEAATGAGFAFGAGRLVRGAAGGITRLLNAFRNRPEPIFKPVLEASEQYGVRLSPTDVARTQFPGLTRRAIRAEHKTLTGVPKFRQEQAKEVTSAAEKFKERYNGDFIEDWAVEAQSSLIQRVDRLRAIVGGKYDRLTQASVGKRDILPQRTVEAIDDTIAQERGRIMPDAKLIERMEELLARLQKGPTDFSRMRDFRSDLGGELKGYYSGQNAILGEKGATVFARLRRNVDRDMKSWAESQGGEIERLWRDADTTYRNMARIYRKKQIAALKDIDDPIQLYDRFKAMATRQPQTLYDALGPRGRRAIQYGLVGDAVRQATKMTPSGEVVSAARVASHLEKLERSLGITFGKNRREIDGFIKLMRAAERSGQFTEYPPTGVRTLFTMGNLARGGGLGVAYMLGGFPAVGGVVAALTISQTYSRVLFTTKAGQRLLLAASHLDPRGEAIKRVINEQLPKVMAAHVTGEDLIPFREVDPQTVSPDVFDSLMRVPPSQGVLDTETGQAYIRDPHGRIRELD